jgi:hypothetical protein
MMGHSLAVTQVKINREGSLEIKSRGKRNSSQLKGSIRMIEYFTMLLFKKGLGNILR